MSMDEKHTPHDETEAPRADTPTPEPGPQERDRPALLRYWVLGALILAGVLLLVVLAVLPRQEPVPSPGGPQERDHGGDARKWTAPAPYEEPPAIDLQTKAIRVDGLITRVLIELGAAPDSIEALAFPAKGEEGFRARSLGFVLHEEPERFARRLGELLERELSKAVLTPSGPRRFSIIMDNVRTHELFLDQPAAEPFTPTRRTAVGVDVVGRLAIVIDDMGEDVRLARGLAETGLPITFAAWPSSSRLDEVAALAREHRLDLLVHLPMEPRGYPEMDPGPGALFVDMTREEIRAAVELNLARIPDAVGVNNHMGSRFTADLPGMRTALEVMAERGLFFLDSRTTGSSKGLEAARLAGTPFYGRDVFIDNEKDVGHIVGQLTKAEKLARRRGMAVAIGHPNRETLAAIRSWAAGMTGDVAVVGISELPVAER